MKRKKNNLVTLKLSKYPKTRALYLSKDWISNGNWAIRRCYVANDHLIAADAVARPDAYKTISEEAMQSATTPPVSGVVRFRATSECHLQADRSLMRMFTAEDGGRAGFSLDYLNMFADLIGDDPIAHMAAPNEPGFFEAVGVADEPAVVIMPMRL